MPLVFLKIEDYNSFILLFYLNENNDYLHSSTEITVGYNFVLNS